MVGGGKSDEPTVIRAAWILRRSGLSGQLRTRNRGCGRRATTLGPRLQAVEQSGLKRRRDFVDRLPLRDPMGDLRSGCGTSARQRSVELGHIDHRLGIRSLSYRQVERLGVAPVPWPVLLVVVLGGVWPVGLV